MSGIVEKVINLLEDGEPHSLESISQKCGIKKDLTEDVISFLKNFDFIELDESKKDVKLTRVFLDFLRSVD